MQRKSPIKLADGCKQIIRTSVSLSLRSRTDTNVISEKQKLYLANNCDDLKGCAKTFLKRRTSPETTMSGSWR